MSAVSGKIGAWELGFASAPSGTEGVADISAKRSGAAAVRLRVRWKADGNGIWIDGTDAADGPDAAAENGKSLGLAGYDCEAERDDLGELRYRLLGRGSGAEFSGLSFRRAGAGDSQRGTQGRKRSLRVRSQMPGKIVRVLAKEGDRVSQGDPLLVMEAMKMENEIRAHSSGMIRAVNVVVGQAVETGADLVVMESVQE